MTWDLQIEALGDGQALRAAISGNGKPVAYANALKNWKGDQAFREFFIGVLAESPFDAYLWETPPITTNTSHRAFEFVLVKSPSLAQMSPDAEAFAQHFSSAKSDAQFASFWNLGGDALLVAPTPRAPLAAYPHIGAFTRTAPRPQQHAFWRAVGVAVADHLSDRPLWLSTCGLGVGWLHVRLDSRPKYYSHQPYRTMG